MTNKNKKEPNTLLRNALKKILSCASFILEILSIPFFLIWLYGIIACDLISGKDVYKKYEKTLYHWYTKWLNKINVNKGN